MKKLHSYIKEDFKLKKKGNIKPIHQYHPKTCGELRFVLEQLLKEDKDANLNCIDISNIRDMSYKDAHEDGKGLFRGLDPHNIDVSQWDMSNVTNISYLFAGCEKFDCDLSDWNVSNVTNMTRTFLKCSSFKGKGLDNWNIKKVKEVTSMFCGCDIFDGKTIENWNINNGELTSLYGMFKRCTLLNCDFSNWDISNIEDIEAMFKKCEKFEGRGLEKWDTKKISYAGEMFQDCINLHADLSNWSIENIVDMWDMFNNCRSLNCNFNKWKLKDGADTNNMFDDCISLTLEHRPSWYEG